MSSGKLIFLWCVLWSGLITPTVYALPYRIARLAVPPRSEVLINGTAVQTAAEEPGGVLITLPDSIRFPFTLTVRGPLGGHVDKTISSPKDLKKFSVTEGLIKNPAANPKELTLLPKLCPRVEWTTTNSGNVVPVYHAERDKLNHTPSVQLLDPDASTHNQYKTYSDMDGKNVLLVRSIHLTYDYEDTAIIDYVGPNPVNGRFEILHEGEGGFYANLHYAVVPYESDVFKFDRQTLLHFAEGKLDEIDRRDLRPALRTHSFLPGPFLSKQMYLYDMCEWGDTAYQAKDQRLNYHDLALWDWDYPVRSADHVLLIVWEGDEEEWLIQDQVISPFYLTDDIVGIFEIRREETLTPLTLKNTKDDFEITVETGNFETSLKY